MSFTNSTPNYGLPQYIGTDKPTYLGDMNTAYSTIDTQMKANADAAAAATSTANTAASTATTASTNATTALNTANSAASEAASATSAAASATSTANTASTNASAALRASAANTIENLAPAYDPTLTYSVGDLVTYIDENNSGKLYKCIVAVGTPESFNINKWDDVTTSEAYLKRGYIIDSHLTVSDASKTWSEVLTALRNNIGTLLPDAKYEFMIHTENATVYKVMRVNYHSNLEYVTVSTNSAFNVIIERIEVKTENSGGQQIVIQPDGTITTTSLGSEAVGVYNLGEYYIMHLDIETPSL